MESELEPDYARDGRREGSGSDGPQAEEEAATAERLPRGEMPEAGVHDPVEDRQEEQEAADLLAQAEDLEPEYDFESAEGGVGSPGQEDRLPDMGRATLIDGDRRQGPWVQESRPGDRVLPRGLEGGPSREVGRRSLRQDGAAVNGTAGLGKGSGAPPSFAGWEEAGFTVQASTRLPADIPNWSTQGSRSSEEARMETLEILVQQLLEQNERLKREVRDHSSRSSGESERGPGADVQDEGRHRPERRETAEGRGTRPHGEVKVKSGKGIGSDGWTPALKIFQPPWTSFSRTDEAPSGALPAMGPGDRFLAATRALQQLHLDDARGGADDDVKMEHLDELPWPVPVSTSVIGLPQFSAAQEQQQAVVGSSTVVNRVEPKGGDLQGEHSEAVQQDQPSTVTVMINGGP